MLRRLALLPLALLLVQPAIADEGELGLDLAALRTDGDVEPALRLRGGWFIPDSVVEIEGQVQRTFGDGAITSVMVGPTLQLPIGFCCGDGEDYPAWTASALVGGARADLPLGTETGLAWQAGLGVKWRFENVHFRLEGGWQGMDLGDADAGGPVLGAGIAFRIGD
jgi:hypothetical protein